MLKDYKAEITIADPMPSAKGIPINPHVQPRHGTVEMQTSWTEL